MDPLFVLAAGGTGAKTVEALLHFCAAGLGPEEVHVLLVDGDASNGNRIRTEQTAASYGVVQGWPWGVEASMRDGSKRRVKLFNSKVLLYSLAQQFHRANENGLLPQVRGDDALVDALGVLLDEDELAADLSIGFAGRPNLGSLVMARHLQTYFSETPTPKGNGQGAAMEEGRLTARDFILKLMKSAGVPGTRPKVAVVGSVFGGTGASLLPVARHCVREQFVAGMANGQSLEHHFKNLEWAKIMMLPYFKPTRDEAMRLVNPQRHLMDASSALWFYGLSALEAEAGEEVTYLIGSDRAETREVRGCDGGQAQANPPFFHEMVAACGVLDFYNNPTAVTVPTLRPVRHLSNRTAPEGCELGKLPQPAKIARKEFLEQLSILVNLAAFSLLAHRVEAEFSGGLFQYSESARLTGWSPGLFRKFLGDRPMPKDALHPANHVLDYFGRLILWTGHTLGSEKYRTTGLEFNPDPAGHYVSLHNTLCEVEDEEVCVGENGMAYREADDHVTAYLCRSAVVALVREAAGERKHDFGVPVALIKDGKEYHVGLPKNWVPTSLSYFEVLDKDKLAALCAIYGV